MAQISTGKSMVAGMASLIVGAVSLGIQDSRPAVLAMPILLTLQVYWLSPGLKEGVLYGNVFRKQTRRVIEISLLLYFTCLYGWTIQNWVERFGVTPWATNGTIVALLALTLWGFALPNPNLKGLQVTLLVVQAISLILAAYNGGEPIDWLLWPAFHATAFDAAAWSVGTMEINV